MANVRSLWTDRRSGALGVVLGGLALEHAASEMGWEGTGRERGTQFSHSDGAVIGRVVSYRGYLHGDHWFWGKATPGQHDAYAEEWGDERVHYLMVSYDAEVDAGVIDYWLVPLSVLRTAIEGLRPNRSGDVDIHLRHEGGRFLIGALDVTEWHVRFSVDAEDEARLKEVWGECLAEVDARASREESDPHPVASPDRASKSGDEAAPGRMEVHEVPLPGGRRATLTLPSGCSTHDLDVLSGWIGWLRSSRAAS